MLGDVVGTVDTSQSKQEGVAAVLAAMDIMDSGS